VELFPPLLRYLLHGFPALFSFWDSYVDDGGVEVVIEAFKLGANFEFAVAYHWSIVSDLSFAI